MTTTHQIPVSGESREQQKPSRRELLSRVVSAAPVAGLVAIAASGGVAYAMEDPMKVLENPETGSIKAQPLSASAPVDPIFAAIEAHRAAHAAFVKALDELDEFESALPSDLKREPRVPIILDMKPDMDLTNVPPDTKFRWCHDEKEIAEALPEWCDREVGTKLMLEGIEKDRRELEAAQGACGLTAMRLQRDRADEAETDAAIVLISVQPTTLAGVSALLRHGAEHVKAGNEWPGYGNIADDDGKSRIGRDWNFFLHRMLAEAIENIASLEPTATAAITPAAAAEPGPIERMLIEWRHEHEYYRASEDIPANDERYDREVTRLEEAVIAADAGTPREALAAVQMAREDYWHLNVDGEVEPCRCDRLYISAFDKAIVALSKAAA